MSSKGPDKLSLHPMGARDTALLPQVPFVESDLSPGTSRPTVTAPRALGRPDAEQISLTLGGGRDVAAELGGWVWECGHWERCEVSCSRLPAGWGPVGT